MWRSSGSTLCPSQMAELLTIYLREGPATLWMKLISAPCIRDLIFSVTTAHDHRWQNPLLKNQLRPAMICTSTRVSSNNSRKFGISHYTTLTAAHELYFVHGPLSCWVKMLIYNSSFWKLFFLKSYDTTDTRLKLVSESIKL